MEDLAVHFAEEVVAVVGVPSAHTCHWVAHLGVAAVH